MIVMEKIKVKELKRKIKELEETIFFIDMIDHWTDKDANLYDKYNKELKQLKDLLIKSIVED